MCSIDINVTIWLDSAPNIFEFEMVPYNYAFHEYFEDYLSLYFDNLTLSDNYTYSLTRH